MRKPASTVDSNAASTTETISAIRRPSIPRACPEELLPEAGHKQKFSAAQHMPRYSLQLCTAHTVQLPFCGREDTVMLPCQKRVNNPLTRVYQAKPGRTWLHGCLHDGSCLRPCDGTICRVIVVGTLRVPAAHREGDAQAPGACLIHGQIARCHNHTLQSQQTA